MRREEYDSVPRLQHSADTGRFDCIIGEQQVSGAKLGT